MRIENVVVEARGRPEGPWLPFVGRELDAALAPDMVPLRYALVSVSAAIATIEATVVHDDRERPRWEPTELLAPRRREHRALPFAVVQVVPTGIRCEIGGYAGDAGPATNLLATAADVVVTHPNAVNASDINEMAANVLYVEGRSLDDFMLGHLALEPVTSNRIGTIVDPTGADHLDDVLHAVHAAMAVKGIDCGRYSILDQELGIEVASTPSGCAVGTIANPDALLRGVERLLEDGCEAVGGVSVIAGVTEEMFDRHQRGEIPNPSGGVEAIITHLVSKRFRIPTAHAPLPYYQDVKKSDTSNPRSAAEFVSTPHYFSVLKGLHRAPRLNVLPALRDARSGWITLENVGAVVVPAGALGGVAVLAAEWNDIPVVAVRDNVSIATVDNDALKMPNVVEVQSYAEAAGVVLALSHGISLASLGRPITGARRI